MASHGKGGKGIPAMADLEMRLLPATRSNPANYAVLHLREDVNVGTILQKRSFLKRRSSSRTLSKSSSLPLPKSNCQGLLAILKNPINVLLVFVPVGLASESVIKDDDPNLGKYKEMIVFWVNFVAMIPLANLLGDATEELAANLKNDMVSGLLNATFGNAVEIIMSIAFISSYQYDILKASMVGSVLSNMLLVLGMSFFFGGLKKQKLVTRSEDPAKPGQILESETVKNKEQHFNLVGALVNNTLLLVACFMMSLTTVFMLYLDSRPDLPQRSKRVWEVEMSRYSSVLIIAAYIAYLYFQLFTHAEMLADKLPEDQEEDEEEPGLDLKCSITLLVLVTCIVSFSSELLSSSLKAALSHTSLTTEFMGVILIPIIGNACEHVSAVRFAMDDRAGLAVGIAVGSSVQISLFAIPFTVLAGWAIHPSSNDCNMDLNFGMLHVVVLFCSVIVVLSVIMDGKSNWLAGYLLMTAYCIAGGLYYFVPPPLISDPGEGCKP